MTLNDAILQAVGGGNLSDGLMAYFGGTGSLNDRERAWLIGQGATPSTLNDMWYEVLTLEGFTGSLNDMQYAYWLQVIEGQQPYDNIVPNSSFAGASGSVSGADWVQPTGWLGGFWPPDDAIALGNGQLQFIVVGNRGYGNQTIDTTGLVGQIINASIYVDEVTVASNQRPVHVTGDATEIDAANNNTGSVGRKYSTYEVTGTSIQIRIGAGTTANTDQNMIISRPQITVGADLKPYKAT